MYLIKMEIKKERAEASIKESEAEKNKDIINN